MSIGDHRGQAMAPTPTEAIGARPHPAGSEAISVEHLSKSYGDELVFEDLDLGVADGEFLCLLGPSGCGKTTLLHMIAGLESPTAGRIVVDGDPVEGPHYKRGVVFQEPRLYPWLDVRKNVGIGPRLRGVEPDDELIAELLDLVGLGDAADVTPQNLSGGMAQRASLARTLANDPDVLLLDEPFSALDELTKMRLQDELLRIVDELGLTTVFVTHDIEEAVYLGDRVIVLGTGDTGISGVVDTADAERAREDPASLDIRRSLFDLLEDDIEGH